MLRSVFPLRLPAECLSGQVDIPIYVDLIRQKKHREAYQVSKTIPCQ